MEKVEAASIEGFNMSIFQLFKNIPKMTITCGKCGFKFKKRIIMVDEPTVICPYCNVMNILPLVVERGG
jgi:DNA-directed RNA polymerase subunit RPC12/RpoP